MGMKISDRAWQMEVAPPAGVRFAQCRWRGQSEMCCHASFVEMLAWEVKVDDTIPEET